MVFLRNPARHILQILFASCEGKTIYGRKKDVQKEPTKLCLCLTGNKICMYNMPGRISQKDNALQYLFYECDGCVMCTEATYEGAQPFFV